MLIMVGRSCCCFQSPRQLTDDFSRESLGQVILDVAPDHTDSAPFCLKQRASADGCSQRRHKVHRLKEAQLLRNNACIEILISRQHQHPLRRFGPVWGCPSSATLAAWPRRISRLQAAFRVNLAMLIAPEASIPVP